MERKLQKIEIGRLKDDRHQTRTGLDMAAIDDLAASISRIGLLSPLDVYASGEGFVVVSGHRRLAACRKLNIAKVSCLVGKRVAHEAAEAALAENLFREDLSPVEMACAMRDVLESEALDLGQLAAGVHRSPHWVDQMVGMLNWPTDVLELVHAKKLSVSAAANLAVITDDAYRLFLIRNAADNGATARTTTAWLQAWRSMAPPEAAVEAEPGAPGQSIAPALPQAPCIVCGSVARTDALANVLICVGCLNTIRNSVA